VRSPSGRTMLHRTLVVLIGLLALAVVVVALGRSANRPTRVTQPLAFSHAVHVTKAKLDCTTLCHAAAATQVYAGLPSKQVCYECHDPDQETPDRPELTRLASYVDREEDLPWQRVAIVPPDVFFSHRRHVTAGRIECARCHPGVAEASEPLSEVSRVLTMEECLDCHRQQGADDDCLACHR